MNPRLKSSAPKISMSAGCVVLILAGLTSSTQASSLLVNWSGKYLSSGTAAKEFLKGNTTNIAGGWAWGYNDETAKNPSSDYDTGASSAVFYGALQATAVGTGTITSTFHRIRTVGDHDEFWISTSNPSDATTTHHIQGLIFWKDSAFLNTSTDVNASQIGSISANVSTFSGTGEVRFAIQSGGQWYLSQVAVHGVGASLSIENINATNWASWAISSSSVPLPAAPTEFTFSGSTFTTVDAIGIYYNIQRGGGVSRRPEFGFANFEVEAIPEASSTVMALLGGVFAFGIFRPFLKRGMLACFEKADP